MHVCAENLESIIIQQIWKIILDNYFSQKSFNCHSKVFLIGPVKIILLQNKLQNKTSDVKIMPQNTKF